MKEKIMAGIGILGVLPLAGKERQETRPNIIVIMADDMGYSDIGCFGSEIHTPNIDRLCSEGMRVTQCYNCARSCPTRAALLTGMYNHKAGVGAMVEPIGNLPNYQGYLNDRCLTIAEALKMSGYTTYMSGKWHVGEDRGHWPCDRGFDKSFVFLDGAGSSSDTPVHVIDIMPTCLEMSGAEYPADNNGKKLKPLDGKSIVPLFTDPEMELHDYLLFEHFGFKALRQGEWKIVSKYPDNRWELYNIKDDRTELHDLSTEMPDKVSEMSGLYNEAAKKAEIMDWKVVSEIQKEQKMKQRAKRKN